MTDMLRDLAEYSAPKAIHAKDSLRFGRRLSRLVLSQLGSTRFDSFVQVFLKVSASVIISILDANYGRQTSSVIKTEELIKLQNAVLQTVWRKLKTCLSYHTNKKICLMKSEYWNIVFGPKTFREHAKSHLAEAALSIDPALSLIVDDEVMSTAFCDVLYAINKLMTMAYILKDESQEGGKFFKELTILEPLMVLMVDPSLYEYYNQSSGKFANECCGKCKICCSRNLPDKLFEQIERARLTTNTLIQTVAEICPRNLKGINEEDLMYVFCLAVQQ